MNIHVPFHRNSALSRVFQESVWRQMRRRETPLLLKVKRTLRGLSGRSDAWLFTRRRRGSGDYGLMSAQYSNDLA